jgi:VanZ family protein
MFLKYNIWGIIWVLIILVACSTPGRQLPPSPFINFDKLIHLFFYGMLQILLMRGCALQSQIKSLRKYYLVISAIFSTLYGIFIELMQGFILKNRSFDPYDISANIVGVVVGIIVWMIFFQKRVKQKLEINGNN